MPAEHVTICDILAEGLKGEVNSGESLCVWRPADKRGKE